MRYMRLLNSVPRGWAAMSPADPAAAMRNYIACTADLCKAGWLTPGAAVSRAVAQAEVQGPAAGLTALDAPPPEATRFQPALAAPGHLLSAMGLAAEAVAARDQVLARTPERPSRRSLTARQAGSTAG